MHNSQREASATQQWTCGAAEKPRIRLFYRHACWRVAQQGKRVRHVSCNIMACIIIHNMCHINVASSELLLEDCIFSELHWKHNSPKIAKTDCNRHFIEISPTRPLATYAIALSRFYAHPVVPYWVSQLIGPTSDFNVLWQLTLFALRANSRKIIGNR